MSETLLTKKLQNHPFLKRCDKIVHSTPFVLTLLIIGLCLLFPFLPNFSFKLSVGVVVFFVIFFYCGEIAVYIPLAIYYLFKYILYSATTYFDLIMHLELVKKEKPDLIHLIVISHFAIISILLLGYWLI